MNRKYYILKNMISIIVSLCMIVSIFSCKSIDYVHAEEGVKYIDIVNGEKIEKIKTSYTRVTEDMDNYWNAENGGWYVVDSDVTFLNRIEIEEGNVNIILADGATLNANGGIVVRKFGSLTIYAQSESESMGKLIAKGQDKNAGIGGYQAQDIGDIIINGGNIEATGGNYSAGIGFGWQSNSQASLTMDNIIINGGNVTATGGYWGAGIGYGSGQGSSVLNNIIINDGTVVAKGSEKSAGIGSGENTGNREIKKIEINNGKVLAQGGKDGPGIGLGYNSKNTPIIDSIVINNGTIEAIGGEKGSGIGGVTNSNQSDTSNRKIKSLLINQGTVKASGTTGIDGIVSLLSISTGITKFTAVPNIQTQNIKFYKDEIDVTNDKDSYFIDNYSSDIRIIKKSSKVHNIDGVSERCNLNMYKSEAAGKIVTVGIEPEEGYELVNVSYKKKGEADDTSIEIVPQDGVYSFEMPDYDVELKAKAGKIKLLTGKDIYVEYSESKSYTGKEILSDMVITDDDYELKDGVDYTIKFKKLVPSGEDIILKEVDKMIEVGEYRIAVVGKGEYKGEFEKKFIIEKADNAPNMPEEIDCPCTTKRITNSLLKDYPDWKWNTDDINTIIPESKPIEVTAIYKGDDCDNYKNISCKVIVSKVHDFEKPLYTWSEDGKTCEAKAVCKTAGCDKEVTEDAKITTKIKQDSTTDKMGITTYIASFDNALFDTQKKDIIDIPKKDSSKQDPQNEGGNNNPSDNKDEKKNEKTETGVGTISADGKTLVDEDGVTYNILSKIKSNQLKANLKVADKKSGGKYKITKVIKKKGKIVGGNVTYMAPYNKNCTKASAGAYVKIGGVKFNITAVNANAFKNCKKLTTFKAGGNVHTIGKNAFNGCASLKSVTITSTKLKSIGAGAFKGTTTKTKYKVPKSKLTKYSKMIYKAGANKKSRITK